MAQRNRTTLKTYFNTGDTPTETQFSDLIDSAYNPTDDGAVLPIATTTTLGGVIADGATITVGVDGTISAVTGGSGDVTGPASATAENVAVFDGITGKIIKDSGVTISGSNTGDQDLTAINAHVSSTSNPHLVTHEQVGADSYHGIVNAGTLSFDDTTHILTIAAGVTYWFHGTQRITAGATTCDLDTYVTLTANTPYYVYFDDASGTLKASGTPWSLQTAVPVAIVYWNGTAGAVAKETHSYTRDLDWHGWAHTTIGARISAADFEMTAPSGASPATIAVAGGTVHDEDLLSTYSAQTNCRVFYQVDSTHYTYVDSSSIYPTTVKFVDSANTYTLTDVGTAEYINVWIYASTDISRPIYAFTETKATAAYNTITLARAATPPSLVGFGLTSEMKLLYRVIMRGNETFSEATDYRSSASLPAGGTTASSASAVTVAPAGTIAATNVQAALEELDTEKMVAVTPGTSGNIMQSNGSAWTSVAPSAGGGQTLYECVVAATGGDYTTVKAALDAGKKRIFVRNGTYTEGAWTLNTYGGNVTIIGEGRSTTILDFGSGNINWHATSSNWTIRNIQLLGSGNWNGAENNTHNIFDSVHFNWSGNSSVQLYGNYIKYTNCIFSNTDNVNANKFYFVGIGMTVANNTFLITATKTGATAGAVTFEFRNSSYTFYGSQVVGNYFYVTSGTNNAVYFANWGEYCTFSGNSIMETAQSAILLAAYKGVTITGNNFFGGSKSIVLIDVNNVVTGNSMTFFSGGNGTGVEIQGDYSVVSGNRITGTSATAGTGIAIGAAADYNTITGNSVQTFLVGINVTAGASNNIIMSNVSRASGTNYADAGTGTIGGGTVNIIT